MAKSKSGSDMYEKIRRELGEDIDDEETNEGGEDEEANDEVKAKAKGQEKESFVEIEGEKVPASKAPEIFAKKIEELNKKTREFDEMKESLARISGVKKETDGSENFDEMKFVTDPEYRKSYLKTHVDNATKQQMEELNAKIAAMSQNQGQQRYDRIKEDVINELDNQGIDFDFKRHEKKIENIVLSSFNQEYIKKNPKKVLIYAINKIVGGKISAGEDDFGIEVPSNAVAGSRKRTAADNIRDEILKATPGDGSAAGQSAFG